MDGSFQFQNVQAGSFTLTVAADGMETESVTGVAGDGAPVELGAVVRCSRWASVSTQVNAISAVAGGGAVQMHDQEKQRLLWVLAEFLCFVCWRTLLR